MRNRPPTADRPPIRPPALRPGSRVALVAPAGPLPTGAVDRAVDAVHGLGWDAVVGVHARARHGYLAGTDAQRLSDLNAALRAPEIDAVWFLRGGYGAMRLLEHVDWTALRERPRPVIGFSDNTALHLAIRRLGLVSFHGPHAAGELPPFARSALHTLLTSREACGALPFPGATRCAGTVVPGRAEGRLVGGNLSLIAATLGTPVAVNARGAILFLEEIGEPAYRVDRLLSQLRLAGVFDGVAGIVIGAFSECPDDPAAGLPSPAEVIADRLGGLGVPVAAGFPFGHQPDNVTLPLGVRARLDAGIGALELLEPAVD